MPYTELRMEMNQSAFLNLMRVKTPHGLKGQL